MIISCQKASGTFITSHFNEAFFFDNFKPTLFKVGDIVNLTDEYKSAINLSNVICKNVKIIEIESKGNGMFLYRIEGKEVYYTLDKDNMNKWFPGIPTLKLIQSRAGNVSLPSVDTSRFPNICRKCGAPAWIGAFRVECSKCGEY